MGGIEATGVGLVERATTRKREVGNGG